MLKPSRREASCCSVAVVNAGVGLRRTVERSSDATVKAASRIRPAAASAVAALVSLNFESIRESTCCFSE